jgi:DNA-binding protein HU-beta
MRLSLGRERRGFNPKTQQKIKIQAKTVVKFRVAKAAKDGVLGVEK